MFEIPSAKRVKRSQLFDSESDSDKGYAKAPEIPRSRKNNHDDKKDIEIDGIPNYGFEYDFIRQNSAHTSPQPASLPTQQNPETYHFHLFKPATAQISPDPSSQTHAQQAQQQSQPQPISISIRSPSPPSTTAHPPILKDLRPASYYFTSALPPATLSHLRSTYSTSAISGRTILSLSQTPWPGTHQPWRVIHLPAHPKQVVVHKSLSTPGKRHPSPDAPARARVGGKPRPSKKRRERARRTRPRIDESKSKEQHEREKRTRKNRERKVKRRAKEREEKARLRATVAVGEGEGDGNRT